jgi:hypothetical protein
MMQVLTDIYQSLFKLQENADLAKAEILVGSCGTHLVFVPGKATDGCHLSLAWSE